AEMHGTPAQQVAADEAFNASAFMDGLPEDIDDVFIRVRSNDEKWGALLTVNRQVATESESTITLQPLVSLSGVISDVAKGQVIEDAVVTIEDHTLSDQHPVVVMAQTNDEGHYRFSELITGHTYMLSVR